MTPEPNTTDGSANADAPSTSTPQESGADKPTGARLHMGIAEQGKVYALEGNHKLALHYYRDAMNIAVRTGEPEIFFRHYLDCVMESLELTASYADVLTYCEKAIALYTERPPPNPLALRDLATIHERRGVIRLKMGDRKGAQESFRAGLAVLRGSGQALPLAQTLLRWLDSGFQLDGPRILAEQRRTQYFSVRKETVDPRRAIKLADEFMFK